MLRHISGILVGLAICGTAHAQQAVDQKRIDDAIRKGAEYLKTAESSPWDQHIANSDELILLTLIHADVPESDAKFHEVFQRAMDAKMERTYKVALLAMCLEELDRVKYQSKIKQCAQFLVDNQCVNGQWSYGVPTAFVDGTPSVGTPKAAVASAGKPPAAGEHQKPKVVHKIPVEKRVQGPAAGDNSNSQYAALGLRACHDAGIQLPRDTVVKLARRWWTTSQLGEKGGKDTSVSTGAGPLTADPRGWSYTTNDPAYGSMTAGAIGAVCIFDYILGDDWKKDKVVAGGMGWLIKNFSVTENVGPCETGGKDAKEFLYYYLYALERVGMLYDTPLVGNHDWYLEGARVILAAQKPDGSWAESGPATMRPTWDTCFAILFLKRATRPLVVSVDRRIEKK